MAYTSHGHQIPGTTVDGRPQPIIRCGGVHLCRECIREAEIVSGVDPREREKLGMERGQSIHDDFQLKARTIVFNYAKTRLEKTDTHVTFTLDGVYVVWFSKTLKNWKALVSTTLPDGTYYEVTFNGETLETYLDVYKKFDNVCIPDEQLDLVLDFSSKFHTTIRSATGVQVGPGNIQNNSFR